MSTHITNNELQEYVDGLLDTQQTGRVESHLRNCSQCSLQLQALKRLERVMRKLSLERVSENFTQRVMEAVDLRRSPGFVRQILANLLPLAIAFMIIVTLVGVFAGEPSQDPLSQQGREYAQSIGQRIGEVLSSGTSMMLEWTMKLVGISAAVPFVKLAVGLLLAFALVVIFDEYVFLPMMKKRG